MAVWVVGIGGRVLCGFMRLDMAGIGGRVLCGVMRLDTVV